MSRAATIESLRAEYEAISRRDWSAVFRDVHPDFDFRPPDRGLVDSGPARGSEGARNAMVDFFSPFEEVTIEPQEFHERVPSSRLEIFEQAGHFPHVDEPQHFIEVLEDFIDSTEPADVAPERWRELLQKGEAAVRA